MKYSCVSTRMDIKNIVNKRSQSQNAGSMLFHLYKIARIGKSTEIGHRLVVVRDCGKVGME